MQQRAFNLLTSSQVRSAFDLSREDPRLRQRYGRTLFGQSTLIARRLVEAGVRFVNVTWDIYWDRYRLQYDGWDTHTRNFPILREYNLPYFDLTYSALLSDLEQRGLLDETLVVVMSEMGRTPRVNANGGRDHWTYCYSTILAGRGHSRRHGVRRPFGRPGSLRQGSAGQPGGPVRDDLRVFGHRQPGFAGARPGGAAAAGGARRGRAIREILA